MGGCRTVALAIAFATLAVMPRHAAADDPTTPVDVPEGELGPSYLVDGGALPFIWGTLAARYALDAYGEPRDTPLAFSSSEGGAPSPEWQMPGWGISALGGVSAVGMIAGGDSSRFYHVKGLAEALSTGVLVTGLIKVTFGRHRPDWDPEINNASSRRSFPSGHSTQAWAIATYSILYLRGHYFDKNEKLTVGEAATYGAIALGAAALSGERVYHNKHHLSDVVIGGLLGSAASTAFYVYQEGRYRDASRERAQLLVTPQPGGATVGFTKVW